MTVRECYEAMGADYDDVMTRLRKDERVKKFLLLFLNDPSFELLCSSMQEKNMDEAFRAAHTLKGVAQNLSLVKMYQSAAKMSDRLRENREYGADLEEMLEAVKKEYSLVSDSINQLKES